MSRPLLVDALDAPVAAAWQAAWCARAQRRLQDVDHPLDGAARLSHAAPAALPAQPALWLHWPGRPALRAWIDDPLPLLAGAAQADPLWRDALLLQALAPWLAWWAERSGAGAGDPQLAGAPADAAAAPLWQVELRLHVGDAGVRLGLQALDAATAQGLADTLADTHARGEEDDDAADDADAAPLELRVLLHAPALSADEAGALGAGAGVVLGPDEDEPVLPLLLRARDGWMLLGSVAGEGDGWRVTALQADPARLDARLPRAAFAPGVLQVLSPACRLPAARVAALRPGSELRPGAGALALQFGPLRGRAVPCEREGTRLLRVVEWPC